MLIGPIDNNITNCFIPICIENVFSEYLNYKGYEYQYAFAHALNFEFNKNNSLEGRIADGLNINYDFINWLSILYKINIEKIAVESVDNLIDYIDYNIIHKNPIIIHLDSFYLPWSTLYNKEHTMHIVVVVGCNKRREKIKILDTIEKEYYFEITKKILKNACKFVYNVILPNKSIRIDSHSFDSKIRNGEIVLIQKERIDLLRNFSIEFLEKFNPKIEFRDKCNLDLMRTEKLVDDIRKNILQINLFCKWMMWREENEIDKSFKSVINLYLQIMSKWNLFVNLLYKNSILGWKNTFNNKGYNILRQVVELEENAYEAFFESLNNKNRVKKRLKMVEFNKNYMNISLDHKFNNKGFCDMGVKRDHEDLTGVGEYFVIEQKESNNIFSCNLQKEYDNIMCEGQEIEIKCDKETSEINLLACAEWGAVDEVLTIIGDLKFQDISLHVHDITQVEEGDIIYRGKTYGLDGHIIQREAAVFWYKIRYDKMCVDKIVLPNCPNLHILALVLAG